ncbi:hypothetical protein FHW03_004303 [Ochrobactrum sp. RH2CCR150]|nr:hypothetical protein [Ochrobactrum sp. RH2CCR150]
MIDVSGDGPNNAGVPAPFARNSVVAHGIVIDGLPIMLDRHDNASIPDLDAYYENCVIGGDGAFLLKITNVSEFAVTILQKLLIEVQGANVSDLQRSAPALKRVDGRQNYNCFIGEEMQERAIGQ